HTRFDCDWSSDVCSSDLGCFAELLPYRPFSAELLHLADYIPQEATFWRRGIYEREGGFVNTEHDFAMDYELWLRFLSVGARFVRSEERRVGKGWKTPAWG